MTAAERAVPYHCPYCGDEDLRPEDGGAWLCASCRRVFTVRFVGLSLPGRAPEKAVPEKPFPKAKVPK